MSEVITEWLGRRRIQLVAVGLLSAVVLAVAVAAWPRSGGGTSASSAASHVLGAVRSGAAAVGGHGESAGAGGAGGTLSAGSSSSGSGSSGSGSLGGAAAGGSTTGGAPAVTATALVATKVIENGQIGLQVRKGALSSAVNSLSLLAAQEGGFVASTSQSSSDGGPTGAVTLRIPNASFADALDKVRALGKVESSNVTGQDVTAQYQDLSDQITALRQAQSQYLTIMAKATTVGDILAVQEQVNSVDSQLQQLEGQQRVLDDQTTYATLAVNLDLPGAPLPPPRPAEVGWSLALHRAVVGFADGVQGLIAASGALAFALIVAAVLGLIGLMVRRRLLRAVGPPSAA